MRRLQRCIGFPAGAMSVVIGVAVAPAEVAKARNVPATLLTALVKPVVASWTKVDVVCRQRFAPIVATAPAVPLTSIAGIVAQKPPASALTDGKSTFATRDFKTLEELVTYYETILYHARVAKQKYDSLELESFHIKDDLKRGLSAFKQAYLDKEKVRLEKVKKAMNEQESAIAKIGSDNFVTEVFNDIINILRLAGEKNEDARVLALKVLDDMTLLGIPFDEVTQQLLKNVAFGDGPFEDSSLLFSCVEYPERGEISIGSKPLESIADEVLKTISSRHETPLDEGLLLRQNDTHPNLQRSAE